MKGGKRTFVLQLFFLGRHSNFAQIGAEETIPADKTHCGSWRAIAGFICPDYRARLRGPSLYPPAAIATVIAFGVATPSRARWHQGHLPLMAGRERCKDVEKRLPAGERGGWDEPGGSAAGGSAGGTGQFLISAILNQCESARLADFT